MLVGASCTAELIQDDPGGLAAALDLPIPVVPLELPSYQRKENWGAAETFYQLVRTLAGADGAARRARRGRRAPAASAPRCNLLGPTALGFRHRDDVREIRGLLERLGIDVNVVAPLGADAGRPRAPAARPTSTSCSTPRSPALAAHWLQRTFGQPCTTTVPIGVGATRDFIAEVAALAGVDPAAALADARPRAPLVLRARSTRPT